MARCVGWHAAEVLFWLWRGSHGFGVGGVSAGGFNEGVFTDGAWGQEFFGTGSAHGTGLRGADDEWHAEAGEDALVCVAHGFVGVVQAGVVDIEGVGVLHDEFAGADDSGAWAGFVTVFMLNLVEGDGKIFVGGVHVFDCQREHFFVGWSQEVVVFAAVFEPEEVGAVFFPTVGGFVGLTWEEGWEVHFLRAGGVHFFADYGFDFAEYFQAEWQPGVDSWGCAAYVSGTHKEFVGTDLCVGRIVAEGTDKEFRHF